ncbi:hypothetical protein Hanom_Chr05g00418391 [Helianthus anomalus]
MEEDVEEEVVEEQDVMIGKEKNVSDSGGDVAPVKVINAPTVLEEFEETVNVSLKGGVSKEGIDGMPFAPGLSFDFDKNIQCDELEDNFTKVQKRKKKQGASIVLGQPNIEYSSSTEKTKIGKKQKDMGSFNFEDIGPNEMGQCSRMESAAEEEDGSTN